MYHEARSLSLLDQELKELLVDDEKKSPEGEKEKEKERDGDDEKEKPKEADKIIKKDETVKKANESGKGEDKAKEDIRREKEFLLEREHAFLNSLNDSHHRLTKSISEKVYPTPICIIDNPETNTKATVWADMKTREVSYNHSQCFSSFFPVSLSSFVVSSFSTLQSSLISVFVDLLHFSNSSSIFTPLIPPSHQCV